MKIVHSDRHRAHFPQGELFGGELVTPFERPARIEYVLRRLRETGMPDPVAPEPVDMAPVRAVHDGGYLDFLAGAWERWVAAGYRGEVIPCQLPVRRLRGDRVPEHIDGQAGYYCFAVETAITAGTWEAAQSSAAVAQTAQRAVSAGDRVAFALCRPPGHHASHDQYGGYCFLNNAAVAAEMFRADGAGRVAILDIDFHHGNGTQDIFYERGDVLFCSLHGDPVHAFPFYLGHADERGAGPGEGANRNYPMPPGTRYERWSTALDDALAAIGAFGADALVISLGVDAYEADPISFFKLESADFIDAGRRIARAGLPTVLVMEGGYAIEAVGVNTVNVLTGFLEESGG